MLVPVHGVATLRVGASGRQTLETTCVAGQSTVLKLERHDTPRSFTVQTADAAPLPDALLRDALGWPLAVTGRDGSVDLPADAAGAAELWIETASGAAYDVEWRSGEIVVAHAASELRVGAAVVARRAGG